VKILVTGASGFIGGRLSLGLAAEGHQVVPLYKTLPARQQASDKFAAKVDLSDRNEVGRLADTGPCEVIVHAAASLDKDLYTPDISLSNCLGMQNILWLADRWKVKRFIYISSVPVVGTPKYVPIDEKHPVEPSTAYHASKFFGESLTRLAALRGLSTISLRLSAPVGAGMPRNRLLPYLIVSAKNGMPIKLLGQGTRSQNYVDVRDIDQAVKLALGSAVEGAFNIAGAETITNYDLAKKCLDIFSSAASIVLTEDVDPEEGYLWEVSIEEARKRLGYSPRYSINDSIAAVAATL
jgi:UDP-glucose 4-epimerase